MLCLIVAVSDNGVIGAEGKPAVLMPKELAHFKKITMGNTLIMGRHTHELIGRRLPGRRNIVISRNPGYRPAEGCIVKKSLKEAVESVKGQEEAFIIGGESVFKQSLPYAGRLYLTHIHATVEGDKYFHYEPKEWREASRELHKADGGNPYDYDFVVLERR